MISWKPEFPQEILVKLLKLIAKTQILLLVNNKQKTSFRYFIWMIQEVSIGRLILISFVSGLFMSSLLNKTLSNNIISKPIFTDDDKTKDDVDYSVKNEDNYGSNEIAPETSTILSLIAFNLSSKPGLLLYE